MRQQSARAQQNVFRRIAYVGMRTYILEREAEKKKKEKRQNKRQQNVLRRIGYVGI